MASEIRVNKIANRAGLSTVEYTDTGIIVSGIVTCTEISGLNALNIAGVSTFASPLDINGDIDVDGHTNLDNLSVAGVATFVGAIGGTFDVDGHTNLDNVNISGMTTTTGNLFLDGGKINVGTGVTIESTTGASATGQATFTGIVTASSFRGDGSQLTGISVGGSSGIDFNDNVKIRMGTGNDFEIYHDNSSRSGIRFTNPEFRIMAAHATTGNIQFGVSNSSTELSYSSLMAEFKKGAECYLTYNSSQKIATSNTGISVYGTVVAGAADIDDFISVGNNIHLGNAGVVTATSFIGDGSNLSNLPAGAPVGGASTNTVFFENDKAVAVNYQITSTKNAMTAGPVAINAGIAVTVPSGCAWTIV